MVKYQNKFTHKHIICALYYNINIYKNNAMKHFFLSDNGLVFSTIFE